MIQCPVPHPEACITAAHGGGGAKMHRLIQEVFVARLGHTALQADLDAALLELPHRSIAFTTDSFVVKPLFFPGGSIGSLAVFGTANDLAMAGAEPHCLSISFILEEGLPLEVLGRVVDDVAEAAARANVAIVTGDTKVVERGSGDGVFITTAGIGLRHLVPSPQPNRIQPGDAILVNGDLGQHGIAIMAQREGFEFDTELATDAAPLWREVAALMTTVDVHCLRDLTRGGLASAANELATASGCAFALMEKAIPVNKQVAGACELLGLDALNVANEGRFVAFVPEAQCELALEALRTAASPAPCRIGTVRDAPAGRVTLKSVIGVERFLDMLSGESLPRIC